MTEPMYNKDGIELLAGQVWESPSMYTRTLLAFSSTGRPVTEDPSEYITSWIKPDNAFHRLISCPVMGDMSQHNIVTKEQKKPYKVPECAEVFSIGCWRNIKKYRIGDSTPNKGIGIWPEPICRVPDDFDAWEPIEPNIRVGQVFLLEDRFEGEVVAIESCARLFPRKVCVQLADGSLRLVSVDDLKEG